MSKYFKKTLTIFLSSILLFLIVTVSILWGFSNDLPDYKFLKNYKAPVSSKVYSGDGELISPSNMKCLVEIKNYTNSVTSKEIEKFVYDMAYTGNKFGLFISLQSNIVTKKGIQFDIYIKEGIKRYCVFVSNTFDELSRVESAIYILENIHKFQNHIESDKDLLEIISNNLSNELTIISIAHRTSTLKNFDRIIKVEKGRIYEANKEI